MTHPRATDDVDLARLQAIYEQVTDEHDAFSRAFGEVASTIDWTAQEVITFYNVINMAISIGATRLARQLAKQGHELYPDSDDLTRIYRIFFPPIPSWKASPAVPGIGASMRWLKEHKGQYTGMWIALKDGELIGTAPTRDALIDQLGPTTIEDHILVAQMGPLE